MTIESLPLAPTIEDVRTSPTEMLSAPSSPSREVAAEMVASVKLSLPVPPYKELAVMAPVTETMSLPTSPVIFVLVTAAP